VYRLDNRHGHGFRATGVWVVVDGGLYANRVCHRDTALDSSGTSSYQRLALKSRCSPRGRAPVANLTMRVYSNRSQEGWGVSNANVRVWTREMTAVDNVARGVLGFRGVDCLCAREPGDV
jgi:hypothetical protein